MFDVQCHCRTRRRAAGSLHCRIKTHPIWWLCCAARAARLPSLRTSTYVLQWGLNPRALLANRGPARPAADGRGGPLRALQRCSATRRHAHATHAAEAVRFPIASTVPFAFFFLAACFFFRSASPSHADVSSNLCIGNQTRTQGKAKVPATLAEPVPRRPTEIIRALPCVKHSALPWRASALPRATHARREAGKQKNKKTKKSRANEGCKLRRPAVAPQGNSQVPLLATTWPARVWRGGEGCRGCVCATQTIRGNRKTLKQHLDTSVRTGQPALYRSIRKLFVLFWSVFHAVTFLVQYRACAHGNSVFSLVEDLNQDIVVVAAL